MSKKEEFDAYKLKKFLENFFLFFKKKISFIIKNLFNIYYYYSLIAKITRHYYFEDFVRVYPMGIRFDRYGKKLISNKNDINNFKNSLKFYIFARQFVKDKFVADIGCGSGYGCKILKEGGAMNVYGSDISKYAINFANIYFSKYAKFTIQGITNMTNYTDDFFDISISSEVIEHLKEYNKEEKAINEIKRITKNKGLIIISTPNEEMIPGHGFFFDEINKLLKKNFSQYCILENALIPYYKDKKLLWEKRLNEGRIGIIISENIDLSETVLPEHFQGEIKRGLNVDFYEFLNYRINTKLLHNTHSWIILAINRK